METVRVKEAEFTSNSFRESFSRMNRISRIVEVDLRYVNLETSLQIIVEHFRIIMACSGRCNKSWREFRERLDPDEEYTLFFGDCQNFARGVVDYLTGKTVGVWPIEDRQEFRP
jgi:hypothetical protein